MRELDLRATLRDGLGEYQTTEVQTYGCKNCGASVEFDPHTHAAECPFCATPVVGETAPQSQIKPQGLLPFGISEEVAHKSMNNWLGGLWFAPNGLNEYARKGRRLDGIYVPYWTYDADTATGYTGQRGTVYYVTESYTRRVDGRITTGTRRVQKIRWDTVRGRVTRFFDDVLVLASKSLPKKFTDGLEPWDLGALEPYQPEYLAGFRAESYTVSLEDGYREAQVIMDRTVTRDIKFDIGGDRQKILSANTEYKSTSFKHVLLPVWMAAYKYRGKSYRFVINGRTGRIQGQRPYSIWKITFAVLVFSIVAVGSGYLIALAQNSGHI
ncbi:hypothetical protein GCM10007939_11780 [Amylibacter marinus]|uniref:Replication restart DNA helicase PriA n=1 Tax=Amylibacter marinus TaxID=1475483 RepID=A0ABQ5VTY4_9RHOB|nr:primosomal protein N' (replication factor Y) - superfamily II helicase [Amylibacter marinus]GLQ34895.1 hypothetical protein GCM10007939_11780 [Amylibacter marinus]